MPHRILVVEDEPGIADNITYALGTENMKAVWCTTATQALSEAAKGGVDLIVLDVGLPDRSGFDVCRELRKTSNVPVIFLTARADEIDRVVGLEIGADDYMVKPFSPRELVARVKAVLRRAPAPDMAFAEAGASSSRNRAFAVDRNRNLITYFGKPLDLSRYEFRILALLLQRPGWVFSRDKIMAAAWEEPESSLDRTVDTHVKTLRAKLEAVKPGADPIQTHRGVGYSLKESL